MLLITKSDVTFFEQMARDIIKIYSNMVDGVLDLSHVEVHAYLVDLNDGKGKQLQSRGAILSPDKQKYALITDILGDQTEALKVLRATALDILQREQPEKYAKYLHSLN